MDLRIQCPALTPTDAPGLTNHCPPMRPKGDQARVLQRDFTNGSQKNSTLGKQTVLFWAAGRKTSLWQEMRPVKEKQKQGGLLMKRIILDITGAHRFSSSPLKKLQLHGPRNPNTFPVQTSSPHPQTPKENRDIQKKSKFTEQYNPEQEFSLQSSFGNFIRSITY